MQTLPVIELRKQLLAPPTPHEVTGIRVRNYRDEADIARWLEVRNAAFAGLHRGNRPWVRQNFEREFLKRWWWSPERLWFAEEVVKSQSPVTAGVIGLALRGSSENSAPSIHWLAVAPQFQSRGIATLLLAHVENSLWESPHWRAGARELFAQTHTAWTTAVRFYERHGFA